MPIPKIDRESLIDHLHILAAVPEVEFCWLNPNNNLLVAVLRVPDKAGIDPARSSARSLLEGVEARFAPHLQACLLIVSEKEKVGIDDGVELMYHRQLIPAAVMTTGAVAATA